MVLFANNEHGERVRATPQTNATCPMCDAAMVAKCGKTVVWHWAHQSIKDCDLWSEGETPWHSAWKSRFSNSEVVITRPMAGVDQSHRADVLSPGGTVIEFQHSAISADDIEDREWFYKDMVWVLDATTAFRQSRVELNYQTPETGNPFCKFKWLQRKRSFDGAEAPLFLDLGLAFRDVGEPFYKPMHWWDDSDDGLKDGIRRQAGVWQRMEITTLLLEIKKRTDGNGWGRVLSHAEFCDRFGGAPACEQVMCRALRSLPDAYSGFDGYVSWRFAFGDMRAYATTFGGNYLWCDKELQKGVTA